MSVLDLSEVIFLMTSSTAQRIPRWRADRRNGAAPTAPVAGRITSMWAWDGAPGGSGGTAPTTSTVLTRATNGALKQALPASGNVLYLLATTLVSNAVGSVIVYDRLVHTGGLSGTTTGAQTTNLPTSALTRRTNGEGVEAWLEIYTLIGTTATTITASYTDEAGNTGNTTPAVAWGGTGIREQDRILPLPLASGDRGVRAVASVNAVASTGTAGAFGVTLAYPVATLPLPLAGVAAAFRSMLDVGGPISLGTDSDSCLAEAWFPNTTTIPWLFGEYAFVEKAA